MTDETLAGLLARALMDAPTGENTNTYVMFGIGYAEYFHSNSRVRRVVSLCRLRWPEAEASSSAYTGVGYDKRLARHVQFAGGQPPRWLKVSGAM